MAKILIKLCIKHSASYRSVPQNASENMMLWTAATSTRSAMGETAQA